MQMNQSSNQIATFFKWFPMDKYPILELLNIKIAHLEVTICQNIEFGGHFENMQISMQMNQSSNQIVTFSKWFPMDKYPTLEL